MKKLIITENQLKYIAESLLSEATNVVEVSVTQNFKTSYPVNSADPKPFIGEFVQAFMNKVNAQPNGPQMLKSGEMMLYSLRVETGASNTWNGQTTPYDYENDYRTKSKSVDVRNPLYQNNVNLAEKRSKSFKPYLMNELKKYNILDNGNALLQTTTKVINTGGVKDEQRDTTKYKNPGQYLYVVATFRYKKDITIEPETKDGGDYTTVTKNMVLTGSYYCNGRSSENREAINKNVWEKQCAQLPNDKMDNKHMSTFEIKWDQDVVKDARVRPLLRWWFTWGSNGKIRKVERVSGTQDKYVDGKAVPTEWTITPIDGNNPELIHYMNINGIDTHGKYIKPYL